MRLCFYAPLFYYYSYAPVFLSLNSHNHIADLYSYAPVFYIHMCLCRSTWLRAVPAIICTLPSSSCSLYITCLGFFICLPVCVWASSFCPSNGNRPPSQWQSFFLFPPRPLTLPRLLIPVTMCLTNHHGLDVKNILPFHLYRRLIRRIHQPSGPDVKNILPSVHIVIFICSIELVFAWTGPLGEVKATILSVLSTVKPCLERLLERKIHITGKSISVYIVCFS